MHSGGNIGNSISWVEEKVGPTLIHLDLNKLMILMITNTRGTFFLHLFISILASVGWNPLNLSADADKGVDSGIPIEGNNLSLFFLM